MSVVRPEFGPTLPELLAPRLRRLSRGGRIALAAVLVLIVAAVAALLLRGGDPATRLSSVVVRQPVAVNFAYRAPLHRVAPRAGEMARLEAANGQTFAVRELRVAPYTGDAAGMLPVYAAQLEQQMGKVIPGFLTRYDGRANVNRVQGYEIMYQYRGAGGKTAYGRRILLLPTVTATQGIDLLLTSPRLNSVIRYDSVGRNGALKTALRSFRFGTQRP